jgi:hypothetical protein
MAATPYFRQSLQQAVVEAADTQARTATRTREALAVADCIRGLAQQEQPVKATLEATQAGQQETSKAAAAVAAPAAQVETPEPTKVAAPAEQEPHRQSPVLQSLEAAAAVAALGPTSEPLPE